MDENSEALLLLFLLLSLAQKAECHEGTVRSVTPNTNEHPSLDFFHFGENVPLP